MGVQRADRAVDLLERATRRRHCLCRWGLRTTNMLAPTLVFYLDLRATVTLAISKTDRSPRKQPDHHRTRSWQFLVRGRLTDTRRIQTAEEGARTDDRPVGGEIGAAFASRRGALLCGPRSRKPRALIDGLACPALMPRMACGGPQNEKCSGVITQHCSAFGVPWGGTAHKVRPTPTSDGMGAGVPRRG